MLGTPLNRLIAVARNIHPRLIQGGPGWLNDSYDIENHDQDFHCFP